MLPTIELTVPAAILGSGTIVGPKEAQGPLGESFDLSLQDTLANQSSWEKAEQHLMQTAIRLALEQARIQAENIDVLIAGDLLNQIITSSFCARGLGIPFLGIYGACSSFTEGLAIGGLLLQNESVNHVLCATSSHNSTAERQYRYPTEYGGQLPPTAQFTVTGAGAAVLGKRAKAGPHLTRITLGRVIDLGVTNPFEMGAAMAPAAADTLYRHFQDTGLEPDYYDIILTGDLARVGKKILIDLMQNKGVNLSGNYEDCGVLIYDTSQKVNAGGSGCACSAVVVLGHMLKELYKGSIKRLLVAATGALMSPTSYQQGESIPGIAHAVAIEWIDGGIGNG